MRSPEIDSSTKEEREKYIRDTFKCNGDCDSCGFCAMFHGKSAEVVFADYVDGKETFVEASQRYR